MMNTLIGLTMITVGLTRLTTGGIISGIFFIAWGVRILKKTTK